MPRVDEQALILRTWDIAESDQLVSFITRGHGKQRGIAKGAKRSRRRFGGLLLPFILVSIHYVEKQGRDLVRIENCDLIRYFYPVYENLHKLLVGSYIMELAEVVLAEGQGAEDIFELLVSCCEFLEAHAPTETLMRVAELKILSAAGFQPVLAECVRCKRKRGASGTFGFSLDEGGVVCGDCVGRGHIHHYVSSEALAFLERAATLPLGECLGTAFSEKSLHESARIIYSFISYHLGRDVRAIKVLRDVFSFGTVPAGP